jgi:hypothetical protein
MGYAADFAHRMRVNLPASMFNADVPGWTLTLSEQKVAQLGQQDGPLDLDGTRPARSDGGDLRASLDADGNSPLAIDLRGWNPHNDHTQAGCEFAVGTFFGDSTAGVDIYLFWGKPDETLPGPNDTYGQYNAYDDDYLAAYCFCDDPATGQIADRTRNQRHAVMYKGSGLPDPILVDGVSGGGAWRFSGSPDINTAGSAAEYTFPSVQNYSYFSVEVITKLTKTTDIIDAGSNFSFSSIINASGNGSIQTGRRNVESDALTVWGTDNSGTTSVNPTSYLPDLLWHYISLVISNGPAYLDYDGITSSVLNLLAPGVNTIYLGLNRNRNRLRTLPAIYDQVVYHQVLRNAAWRNATRRNLLEAATYITGYPIEDIGGQTIQAAAADGLGLADSSLRTAILTAAAADSLALAGANQGAGFYPVAGADVIGLTDQATRRAVLLALAADALGLSDTATSDIVGALVGYAADSLLLADSGAGKAAFLAAVSEAITINDATAVGKLMAAMVDDALALSDRATLGAGLLVAAADSITFTDDGLAVASFYATATDTITVDDLARAGRTFLAAVADALGISDTARAINQENLPQGLVKVRMCLKRATIQFLIKSQESDHENC